MIETITGTAMFFRPSGKWYDSIDFSITVEEESFTIFDEVEKKFLNTYTDMNMVVTFNNGKYTYPFMIPANKRKIVHTEKRKIVLTERERKILIEEKEKGYNYIARDANDVIYAYRDRPRKVIDSWLNDCLSFHPSENIGNICKDCFKFMWFDADDEPYIIEKLLKESEEDGCQ